jgi:ComEC/Rec2-related protein
MPTLSNVPASQLLRGYEAFWVLGCLLFLWGNLLGFYCPDSILTRWQISVCLQVILLGALLTSLTHHKTPLLCTAWIVRLCFWLTLFLFGIQYFSLFQYHPEINDVQFKSPDSHCDIQGQLIGIQKNNQWIVAVQSVNQHSASGQLLAYFSKSQSRPLQPGQQVHLAGALSAPFDTSIPGAFSQKRYLKTLRVTAILRTVTQVHPGKLSPAIYFRLMRFSERLKQQISQVFSSALPKPHAAVLGGLVLGDRAIPVDAETRQSFIQTGLIHLLAASGMNVGIIAGAVLWLLAFIKTPPKIQILLAMVAVGFYSLLTGLPPSIQRAASMLEIALLLKLIRHFLSPVFLLCLASCLLVMVHPETVGNIGFQFSILSTFGLLSMVAPLQKKLGFYITKKLAAVILVPTIAQLWVLPLSILYFNRFPLHGIALNIISVILITPLTLIGFLAGSIGLIYPEPAGMFSLMAIPFLNALLWIVHWGNQMKWAQYSIESPPVWLLCIIYAMLLWAALLLTRQSQPLPTQQPVSGRWKTGGWTLWWLTIAFMLLAVQLENWQRQQQTSLAILPLSYKQHAIIVQPAHTHRVIGIVPATLNRYEARTVSDYLRFRNIQYVDLLLLTQQTGSSHKKLQTVDQTLSALFQHATGKASTGKTLVGKLQLPSLAVKTPELYSMASRVSHYPVQGLQVNTGNMMLLVQSDQWAMLSGSSCLMSDRSTPWPTAYGINCLIETYTHENGLRLQSRWLKLSANQYYDLTLQDRTLSISGVMAHQL